MSILAQALALTALTLAVLAPAPAQAREIPAFARKYGMSCALCHNPAPRLTAFGEDFAARGFQMALDESPRDTVATGDAQLLLMRSLPLAIRLDAYVRALGAPATDTDLQTPWLIKLLSGGQIANRVSYYLYFFMAERGEVAGLEDAYVQFSDLGGCGVDLLVGQFQISDPLFKRELRLEYEDYQAYRVRVGAVRADLTYDRGFLAAYSPRPGTDLSVQLVNGSGIGAADESRSYDHDDWKNVALRASQDAGRVRLGAFGYFGREGSGGVRSRFRVLGADATMALGPELELNVQYLRRNDGRPFLAEPGPTDTDVDMGFAELVWSPQGPGGRWFFTGLYNHVEADAPIFTVRQGEQGRLARYRSSALGANYMVSRNLRLTAEAQYDPGAERARLVGGFMAAF